MDTWIEIDSFILIQNVRRVRDLIGDGAKLWAVIKANAYGHGLELVSDALWKSGVDGFVVTDVADALFLSEHYYHVPILLLNPPEIKELPALIKRKIQLPIVSQAYWHDVQSAVRRLGLSATVHLEIETGMHRLGMKSAEARQLLESPPSDDIVIEGVYTHIYDPDDDAKTTAQIDIINDLLFGLQRQGIQVPMVHILSSKALTAERNYHDALFDAVRVGRLLYGYTRPQLTTDPVLTWKTRILRIDQIKRGDSVSYGGLYVSDRDRYVATLPVGYSHGLDRRLSNKGEVLIQGKRCPILGAVGMNDTMVDLSPILYPSPDDEVVLLGAQGKQQISSEMIAETIGSIDYEIFARLSPSIPRIKIR